MRLTTVRTSVRSARKAKGDGYLRRAEILEAAERIFVTCGYEGATIRKIADEVGLSSTALYMHFEDKSDIIVEICRDSISALMQQNRALVERDMDPVARLRDMLAGYMRFALGNTNAYQLVFCDRRNDISVDKMHELSRLSREGYDLYLGALVKIAAAGRLKSDDTEAAAQVSWAAAHGLAALLITRKEFDWRDEAILTPMMVDMVCAGLVAS